MYGLRGCAPSVSCMGLGLLKELTFLKVCLKQNLPKQQEVLILNWSNIIFQTDITVSY